MGKLRFAMVCASNQNRSMEAHCLLQSKGYQVSSFGVGQHVKLPGPSAREPNVYSFGTPYTDIFEDLRKKGAELYTRNGLLQMVQRNIGVKHAPERWQDNRDVFDVVVTFEERVMEQLLDDMKSRTQTLMQPVLIVNIDVKDNHQEAANAAPQALRLCEMLEAADDWEEEVEVIVTKFEQETGRKPLYSIEFY